MAAPLVQGPSLPGGQRVPSGKMSTEIPAPKRSQPCWESCFNALVLRLRSMAIGFSIANAQPKNGMYNSSRLRTVLTGKPMVRR